MKSKRYFVQAKVDALVQFEINASNLDEAVDLARHELKEKGVFGSDIEFIDGSETVTGVYE